MREQKENVTIDWSNVTVLDMQDVYSWTADISDAQYLIIFMFSGKRKTAATNPRTAVHFACSLCPWFEGQRSRGSWSALLKSAIKSRPVIQTPVSESTETAPRDSLFLFNQTAAVSALRGLTHQWQPQSDHTPTIKYSFIRSVLQSGTPLQKHVLFSLTYSTGDTNQQWHCHLWAMQYDSLVVQMSDYTVQY